MRSGIKLAVLCTALLFTSQLAAQDATARLDRLRQELAEIQMKETELRARLEQLNEAIKPENIERSLAGVGSTRPEELREHRRKTLTIERDSVAKQLQRYEERRMTLEAAIATAETEAYHRSAQPSSRPSTQMFVSASAEPSQLWIALPVGLAVLLVGGAAVIVIVRRRSA
ncbi:MAG: hypothetical protein WAQ99_04830 [Pyrinomonadaceae bacterium]